MEVYLDNGATTKPRKEVVDIINKSFTEYYGNPSSLHKKGVEIEREIKKARKKIAKALGAEEKEIYFTSGGTESNNLSILGGLEGNKRKGNHVITTRIEHPSILETFKALESKGYDVTYLDVDNKGFVNIEQLHKNLRDNTALVSIMFVNNEVGSIQSIGEISKILSNHPNKPLFHVDAIQAFGKININVKRLNINLLSISGHKINGPKGIGALYIKNNTKVKPIIFGGNQELGMRSGTENVHGILGMGVAAELAKLNLSKNIDKMKGLKSRLLKGIKDSIKDVKINSYDNEDFSPHILNVSFIGIRGEVLLHTLEQHGIYVSTGSACSSKKKNYSHVLKAMGLSERELEGAIRFSFSPFNTEEEIDYTLDKLSRSVKELRKVMGRR